MANGFFDAEDLQYNQMQQTQTNNNSFFDAEDLQYNLPQQKTTQSKPKPQVKAQEKPIISQPEQTQQTEESPYIITGGISKNVQYRNEHPIKEAVRQAGRNIARPLLPKKAENWLLGSKEDENLLKEYENKDIKSYEQLTDDYKNGLISQQDYINGINLRNKLDIAQSEDDYRQERNKNIGKGAVDIGSGFIPVGGGAKIAAKGAQLLRPLTGRKAAQAISQGIVGGALGGGAMGLGEGLIDRDINPIKQAAIDASFGAIGGAAFGGAIGAIGNKIRRNNINNLLDKRKDWGIAYQKASGNPELAINTLLEKKQGFVPNAIKKSGLGNIDLVYGKTGKKGYGLAHIIEQREKDGLNGLEFVKGLPELIQKGKIYKDPKQPNIAFIKNNDDSALVKLVWNEQKRKWIVTSFRDKKALNKPIGRTPDIANKIDDMTPSSDLSSANNIIPDNAQNLNPNVTKNIEMPDTIYNEQTAKTAQKGIQKEIGDMIEKPTQLEYINRRYKNRFYKQDVSSPEQAAMHEGDIEINKILKEIKDNPDIINDPEKLAELESRIPQYTGGLEYLTEHYYNKFYQAVAKAADYNKVGQDLNLSNAAREAGEIKQSRLAATADNPKEIEQISKELEKKGRLPEYEVLHNAEIKQQAKDLVDKDLYKTYSSLTNKVTDNNADFSALDFETARQTIEKLYKEGTDEAIENANKLTIEISKKATEAGQAVQALSLWHKTTPSGAVKAAEKLISEYNTKHPKTPLKLTKEKTKEIIAQAEKIQQQKLLNPDEYMDRKAIVEAAKLQKSIYSVVPKSVWEKNMGFRYINMLLSPKSRIKDFVLTGANTADTAADELIANYLIDTPRALLTKSKKVFNGLHPKAWASGIKKGFKEGIEDVREGINTSRGGEVGRYGVANTTFNYKPLSQIDTTGLNPLQKAGRYISQGFENAMVPLEKSLQYSLQVPDRMFYEGRYASSLIDQMKAAGVNAPTDAMKKRAVEEARRAVYQENRPVTDFMLNMVKDQDNPIAQMAKYQIPFIKTPTNITAQGLEGLHGLFTGGNKLRNAMTPEQIREAELLMARGIKGLGELGLGVGIGKGLYNTYTNIGNNNYEENEITGLKPQSVAIGDKAISLQNYQQALPAFTGVGLVKGGLGGAVDATTNAIMDMPALKALGDINRISKQTQYIAKNADDSDYLARKGGEIARSLGTNAITSEIPLSGFLGELRNDIDPYSREMRVPNDGTLQSTGQYIGNRILNRLPGASRLLPQKYNAVGQPAMINNIKNPFARVLSEAIDLGVRNYTPNETYNYLKNVNDMANKLDLEGKTGTALTKAKKKIKINGEDVQLNNKQYSEYQRIYGQLRTNLTQELINSGKYNNLDPQLTTTDINDVRKSADEAAKYLLFGNELKKKPNRYTQYLINNLSNYLTQEE